MRAVGYHWSPTSRRAAIHAVGWRIGCRPVVNGIQDDPRNSWISLSPTPWQAWALSAGALAVGGFPSESPLWDLWRADLTGLELRRCDDSYPEVRVLQPVSTTQLRWIASRPFLAAPTFGQPVKRGAPPEMGCHSDETRPHPRLTRFTGLTRALAAARRLQPTAR
jgi:hypothetical protein